MLDLVAWSSPYFPGAEEFDPDLIDRWRALMTQCTPRWEQIKQGHLWLVEEEEMDDEVLANMFGE